MFPKKFWLILLFVLSGCHSASSSRIAKFEGRKMTIDYHISIGDPLSCAQKNAIEKKIAETFDLIDRIYNDWNPDSEISRLNELPAFVKAPLSPELEVFLARLQEIFILTEGRFDPTVKPLVTLWKKHLCQNTIPSLHEREMLFEAIGWKKIHVEEGFVWKENSATQIDLGGVSKGYCVDLLVDALKALHITNCYVEWGGEIRTLGRHPDGRDWCVQIQYTPERIEMQERAVATSGDYYQFWEVEGTTYLHIIDPQTKAPLQRSAESLASATVIAPNCTLADALATALMIFSLEEGKKWAEEVHQRFPEIEFYIAYR